jgi:hypothetical protein
MTPAQGTDATLTPHHRDPVDHVNFLFRVNSLYSREMIFSLPSFVVGNKFNREARNGLAKTAMLKTQSTKRRSKAFSLFLFRVLSCNSWASSSFSRAFTLDSFAG